MSRFRIASIATSIGLATLVACAPARSRPATSNEPLVTAEELERNPGVPIEVMIQRKVPGVIVTRVGDGIGLMLRGQAGYDERYRPPLYILNGSPFTPGPNGELTGIDPYEIATIKVLRGAEASLYGIDAAYGVIVITTKGATPRR